MKGLVAGLRSPHPLGAALPSAYREDEFAQGLCESFDEVLAPVIAALDCWPSYLDPAIAPDDMLAWLAGWMGIVLDGHQSAGRQREFVRIGVDLLRWRGTARGIRAAVGALFDAQVEVVESGGTGWSPQPNSPLPGSPRIELVVRLGVDDPDGFDIRRLDALVTITKPIHVRHRVEVTSRTSAV